MSDQLNWFQVHVDLRLQWDELSVDRLMEMFVVSKMTGLEKPGPAEFDEFHLDSSYTDSNLLGSGGVAGSLAGGQNSSQHLSEYLDESSQASQLSSTAGKVREGRTCNESFSSKIGCRFHNSMFITRIRFPLHDDSLLCGVDCC